MRVSFAWVASLGIFVSAGFLPAHVFGEEERPRLRKTINVEFPLLEVLGKRTEHPDESATRTHVFLRRKVKARADVKLEIVHPGYCDEGPDGKPELRRNQNQTVNVLEFDTGAHMRSTVVILCEGGTTTILDDFDKRVQYACATSGKQLPGGYVSVTAIRGRKLEVLLLGRNLKPVWVEIELLPRGHVKLLKS